VILSRIYPIGPRGLERYLRVNHRLRLKKFLIGYHLLSTTRERKDLVAPSVLTLNSLERYLAGKRQKPGQWRRSRRSIESHHQIKPF